MTYEQVKHLKPGEFKRLCGVRPLTFAQMLEVMQAQAGYNSSVQSGHPDTTQTTRSASPTTQEGVRFVPGSSRGLKKKTGRPSKLSIEDQLLLTLEYWREYRTYFHISQSYNEST